MLYEYRCINCNNEFEKLGQVGCPNPICPVCNSETNKLISNINFVVHGSPNRSLDCLVGDDSDRRWKYVRERKSKRDKKRKEESKNNASTNSNTENSSKG